MRKTIMTALTVALTAGSAAAVIASVPATAAPATPSSAASAYTPPPIAWSKCTTGSLARVGADCGFLTVPLDYADPTGTTIRIAVSRVNHTAAGGRYQGVMLVNPGGPGGSGLGLSVLGRYVPNNAGYAYDWIGFDPRGVGSSQPSLSCNRKFFMGDRPPYRPTEPNYEKQWVARSIRYANACAAAPASALLGHVKTVDTVKDMESLRIALGQKQINYYGFSYGTYLGQVYATMNPGRVRRMVWDGTVDPERVFYLSNQDQDRAFQKTFDIYFDWIAAHDNVYHLGTTHDAIRTLYLNTIAKLDVTAEQGILGGDELTDVFTSAGYYVYGWEDIAQAFSDYINNGDPSALIDMYTSANPTTAGGDNGYAMYLATQCTDAPWPRSQISIDADNKLLDQTYDYFTWSNAWFNGPCAYWPAKARVPVVVDGSKVTAPILMIGETFDAATPFNGSLVVRSLFPTASLIEGKNGTTHAGSLSGVSCTDDAIAAYLTDGTVPTRLAGTRSDKICPPVPAPDPQPATATSAARTGGTAAVPLTRAALAATTSRPSAG